MEVWRGITIFVSSQHHKPVPGSATPHNNPVLKRLRFQMVAELRVSVHGFGHKPTVIGDWWIPHHAQFQLQNSLFSSHFGDYHYEKMGRSQVFFIPIDYHWQVGIYWIYSFFWVHHGISHFGHTRTAWKANNNAPGSLAMVSQILDTCQNTIFLPGQYILP